MPSLDVIILTMNEEGNLPDCLASLQGLDCAIHVVDSGSGDRTVEIASAAGAEVLHHAFESYGEQRNWALDHVAATTPWILNLDADERLTPELAAEIREVIAQDGYGANGFRLRRRTVFMNRWIRHGGHYPNYQLRLFRRGKGRCEERRYDQHFVVQGEVRSLEHDYIDIVAASLSTWSARHVRWAGAEAEELTEGAAAGSVRVEGGWNDGPIARRRRLRNIYGQAPLFLRPLGYFLYRYFLRLGFLDGKEGLIFHFLQGFWFRFLTDAMIYERRRGTR